MTTPCERLKILLSSAPEAALALPALSKGLADHTAECGVCKAEQARALALVQALEGLYTNYSPPADLVAKVLARGEAKGDAKGDAKATTKPVDAATAPKPAGSRSRTFWLGGGVGALAAAAAALIVSQVGGGTTNPPIDPSPARTTPPGTQVADPTKGTPAKDFNGLRVTTCFDGGASVPCGGSDAQLETAVGETRAARLSDGSMIELAQDTRVVFDHDGRGLRVERGEAYFDLVRRDDLAPLMVRLPTGEAKVLGTALVVRAGRALSVVDVVRGLVAVSGDGETEKVGAGQAAWIAAGKAPIVRTSAGGAVRPEAKKGEAGWAPADLGFGTIRARRPGATADTDKPLRLVDHLADVKVQGFVARTTIEESFANDTGAELEGIYRFAIPAGAQVAELSLLVDGRWEEGAFVERDRAEKIWAGVIRNATPILKRREIIEYIWVPGPWRDPALLSWREGNTFELRIFPIPANGERRVRISYSELLPRVSGGRRYTLPLPQVAKAAARAEHFGLTMRVGGDFAPEDVRVLNYAAKKDARADGSVSVALDARGFQPHGDMIVEVPELGGMTELTGYSFSTNLSETGETQAWTAVALRPDLQVASGVGDRGGANGRDVLFIVDRSYSTQAARIGRAADFVAATVEALGSDDRVRVLACGTSCKPLGGWDTATPGAAAALKERIARLEPLGATRLGAAFDAAQKALARDGRGEAQGRIIYIGDGIPTVGELDGTHLAADVRAVLGDRRVVAVSLGGSTDRAFLAGVTRDGASAYIDAGALGSVQEAAHLTAQRLTGFPLEAAELVLPEGYSEVAPATLGTIWPGEEKVVTARWTGLRSAHGESGESGGDAGDAAGRPELGQGEVVLRGKVAGENFERRYHLTTRAAEGNAFVPRLWAERRIADLAGRDDEAARTEGVAISRAHHLLSPWTSLLVLESPAMAKAFGVTTTTPVAAWDGEEAISGTGGLALDAMTGANKDSGGAGYADDDIGAAKAERSASTRTGGTLGESEFDAHEGKKGDRGHFSATPPASASGPSWDRFHDPRAPEQPMKKPVEIMPDVTRRGGDWVAMRRVWYKEAVVRGAGDATRWEEAQLAQREARLDEEPNSRERTLAVVRWRIRVGQLEGAERMAQAWLARDRMDAEALLTLSDLAARRGDLERAQELLASAVEVDPRAGAAQARMAAIYDAAGEDAQGCEHLMARALSLRSDPQAQADAIRCGSPRERILSGLETSIRDRAELILEREPKSARVNGPFQPFQIDATWDGAADLDLVVVSPAGRVISWLGGAAAQSVEDARSGGHEKLVYKASDTGRWQIFVVRHGGGVSDEAPAAISGTLRVTAHGTTRRMEFALSEGSSVAHAADIDVQSKSRLEPVRGMPE